MVELAGAEAPGELGIPARENSPEPSWLIQNGLLWAQFCLISALLLCPLIFVFSSFDNYGVIKLTTLWVFGVVAMTLWISCSYERRVWLPTARLFYAAAAFLIGCVLATTFSISPTFSLLGRYVRHGGLVPILLYASIALTLVGIFWERPEDLSMVAQAVAITTFLSAVYIIVQAAGRDWGFWRPGQTPPFTFPPGSLGNSNFSGAYLGIGIPFLAYSLVTAKGLVKRVLVLAAIATTIAGLWLTHTRGGIMAMLAGLAAIGFGYRDRFPRWFKVAGLFGSVMAGLAVVWVAWNPSWLPAPKALAQLWLLGPSSLHNRFFYWGAAWRIFLDHPVVGTGLDTYYALYPKYRSLADGAKYGLVALDKPHNIFLEYAANGGALVAVSYIILVFLALRYGFRRARQLEGRQRLLLVCFLATLAAYLAQGFFSIDIPPLAVMGWVTIAGIAVLADPGVIRAREARMEADEEGTFKDQDQGFDIRRVGTARRAGRLRLGLHPVFVLVAFALIWIGLRPLLADLALARRGPEAAIKLHPTEAFYRVLAGGQDEHQALRSPPGPERAKHLERAVADYKKALSLQPRNLLVMTLVARIYQADAARDPQLYREADRWWGKVVAADPADWDVKVQYAAMLHEWAEATGDKAIQKRSDAQLAEAKRIKREYG